MYSTLFLFSLCSLSLPRVSTERLEFKQSWAGNKFNFTNCNRTAVPLYVTHLKLMPHPIRFDDMLMVSLKILLQKDIGVNLNNIEVDISLRLKTQEGFTELCDLIGQTACHYNDFCATLANFMEKKTCPAFVQTVYNNNCSCPFKKDEYVIPMFTFKLPKLSFEVRGTFEMTIDIHEHGRYLGCIETQFCISNCKPLGFGLSGSRVSSIPTTLQKSDNEKRSELLDV